MLKTAKLQILLLITCLFFVPLSPLVATAQGSDAHVVVNTFRLNVRTGPGVGHSIITALPGGTSLPVTMLSADRKWYEVAGDFGSGWLHSAYAVPRGDFSSILRAGAQPDTAGITSDVSASAARLVVNTAFLNVRSGPGVGHSIVTTVRGGTELAVLSIAPDRVWYEVVTASGNGWVHSRFTIGRGDFSGVKRHVDALTGSAPRAVVNTARLNIRSGPSAANSIISSVPGGATLAVLGKSADDKWFLVEADFGQGWLRNLYVAFRGDYSQVPLAG